MGFSVQCGQAVRGPVGNMAKKAEQDCQSYACRRSRTIMKASIQEAGSQIDRQTGRFTAAFFYFCRIVDSIHRFLYL
jgi:hypothetical protein